MRAMRWFASLLILASLHGAATACDLGFAGPQEEVRRQADLRVSSDSIVLASLIEMDQQIDRRPARLRFHKIASIAGRGPKDLTADGNFWTCTTAVGANYEWAVGDLAIVYAHRAPLDLFPPFEAPLGDHPTWDGWRVLDAIPPHLNADVEIAALVRSAANRLR